MKDKIVIKVTDPHLQEAFQKTLFDLDKAKTLYSAMFPELTVVYNGEYEQKQQSLLEGGPIFTLPQQWNDALAAVEEMIKPKEKETKSFEEKFGEILDLYDNEINGKTTTYILIQYLINEYYIPTPKEEEIEDLKKQVNFLQLFIQLLQGQITDKEYEKELLENEQLYFIEDKYKDVKKFEFDIDDVNVQATPKQKLSINTQLNDNNVAQSEYYYLKEEEIIQKGDEIEMCEDGWVYVDESIGKKVSVSDARLNTYRRKLPVKQKEEEEEMLDEKIKDILVHLDGGSGYSPAIHEIISLFKEWHNKLVLKNLKFPLKERYTEEYKRGYLDGKNEYVELVLKNIKISSNE